MSPSRRRSRNRCRHFPTGGHVRCGVRPRWWCWTFDLRPRPTRSWTRSAKPLSGRWADETTSTSFDSFVGRPRMMGLRGRPSGMVTSSEQPYKTPCEIAQEILNGFSTQDTRGTTGADEAEEATGLNCAAPMLQPAHNATIPVRVSLIRTRTSLTRGSVAFGSTSTVGGSASSKMPNRTRFA